VRELRDEQPVTVDHGRLGPRTAQRARARRQQHLHGMVGVGPVGVGRHLVRRAQQLLQRDELRHIGGGGQELQGGARPGEPQRALAGDVADAE
jgi:hypothetical protein